MELKRNADVSAALGELVKQVAAARAEAGKYKADWQEARRASRGERLASCDGTSSGATAVAEGAGVGEQPASEGARGPGLRVPGAPTVHLLWRFVGLHDGAFTGLEGEPLFAASREYALDPARADTDSPYTIDDALDVAADNAFKLSACRRDVAKAREVVEQAAAAWGKEHQ